MEKNIEYNRQSNKSTMMPQSQNRGSSARSSDFNQQSTKGTTTTMPQTLSRGSSVGSSDRNSFSTSFGLPIVLNIDDDNAILEIQHVQEKTQDVPIRRLAYLNKPEIPFLFFGSLAAVVNGVTLPIFGILISSVIKIFYEPPHQLRSDSKFWALMFMVLGTVSLLAFPIRTYLFSVAGCKLIERVRALCFEKVVHMEVGWFDVPEHSSGAIGARLSADAALVRALVGDALGMLVQNIASAVAGLVIAFVASWQLALIVLALVPLIGINGLVQARFVKGFSADSKVTTL